MNRNTIRALLADARYQVFDNVVFRILLGGSLLLVLCSFAIAFKEDRLSILFGTWSWDYADVFFVGSGEDAQARGVQSFQALIVEQIVGNFGIMLCIAATAFFTPRLLEKGAADNTFSKPIGRFTLLLSRYFAGLLFVALLASVLVGGMYLGFAVSSGYNDPGFLWSAFTLVYLYAILQSISICVATLMRNTVAAILITITAFMMTGCVNFAWLQMSHQIDHIQRNSESVELSDEAETEDAEGDEVDEESIAESGDRVLTMIHGIFETIRTVLPRTSDADILARKMKRAVEGVAAEVAITENDEPVYYLQHAPSGMTLEGEGLADLDGDGLRWVSDDEVLTLVRRPRAETVSRTGRKGREKLSRIVRQEVEELEASLDGVTVSDPERDFGTTRIEWTDASDPSMPNRQRCYIARDEHYFRIEHAYADGSGDEEIYGSSLRRIELFVMTSHFNTDPRLRDPNQWYESKFTMEGDWQYNVLASIGTSLAFTLLMLAIAGWRLSRTDF